jgi:hypothetical protein
VFLLFAHSLINTEPLVNTKLLVSIEPVIITELLFSADPLVVVRPLVSTQPLVIKQLGPLPLRKDVELATLLKQLGLLPF